MILNLNRLKVRCPTLVFKILHLNTATGTSIRPPSSSVVVCNAILIELGRQVHLGSIVSRFWVMILRMILGCHKAGVSHWTQCRRVSNIANDSSLNPCISPLSRDSWLILFGLEGLCLNEISNQMRRLCLSFPVKSFVYADQRIYVGSMIWDVNDNRGDVQWPEKSERVYQKQLYLKHEGKD
jgi:hypothetical protein